MKKSNHQELTSALPCRFTIQGFKSGRFFIGIFVIPAIFLLLTAGCGGKKRSAAAQKNEKQGPFELPYLTLKDSLNYDCQRITQLKDGDTLAIILPDEKIFKAIVNRSSLNINQTHTFSATIVDHPSGKLSLSTTRCVSMGTIIIPGLSVAWQIVTDREKSIVRINPIDDSQNLQKDDVLIPPRE